MNFKGFVRKSVHASAFLMYLAALIRYEFLPPMPHVKEHEAYAGRLKYLTYWDVWVQFMYFGLSLYIDFQKPSSRLHTKFVRIRDKFFSTLALPYGLFVFSVFWILYLINRELIFPRVLDAIFPAWLNHVSHTAIVPALLIESFMIKHRRPRKGEGLPITILFGAVYICWVLYLALVMDIWVYPILKILDWGMRVVFFVCCLLFIIAIYFVGEKINHLMWS